MICFQQIVRIQGLASGILRIEELESFRDIIGDNHNQFTLLLNEVTQAFHVPDEIQILIPIRPPLCPTSERIQIVWDIVATIRIVKNLLI